MQGTNGVAGIRCGALTLGEIMNCCRAGNVFSNEVLRLQMCAEFDNTCKDRKVGGKVLLYIP